MSDIHAEKINYLYSTDNTGKPVARYGISDFPVSTKFTLQSLLFDFEISKTYEILIYIKNSNDVTLVKSKNNYTLNKNALNDISFTNAEHTRASTVITINTPIVNIVGEDIYQFTISVNNQNGTLLDSQKTYAIIQKDS
ncbi:hypothetical protein IAR49_10110 [Lactiplantibacillus plantarum]|nr:hypothetical protein [Lactiplantibacillus plantarum]